MSYEYSFDAIWLISVLDHLQSFKMTVLTMQLVDTSYFVTLNTNIFPPGQYEHLQENFNFQQVNP